MVEHPNIDERERVDEPPGNGCARGARLCDAGGMVVGEYDRRRVEVQRVFYDLAWMHCR